MSRSQGELQTSLWEKQRVPMHRDQREPSYEEEVGSLTARVFLFLLQPVNCAFTCSTYQESMKHFV